MLCNFKWLIIKVDDAREVQGERSVQVCKLAWPMLSRSLHSLCNNP